MQKKFLVFLAMLLAFLGVRYVDMTYLAQASAAIKYVLLALKIILGTFVVSYILGYFLKFWENLEEPGYKTRFLKLSSPNLLNPKPSMPQKPQRHYTRNRNTTPRSENGPREPRQQNPAQQQKKNKDQV